MSSEARDGDERRLDSALANRVRGHRPDGRDARAPASAASPSLDRGDAVHAREDDPVVARHARDGFLERAGPRSGGSR